ncbi:MAG: PASTA domain-containing protein [Patescibacteria group bacterium]|nr:PASTA domain-containing protein [Patescibacteria group bacterium]
MSTMPSLIGFSSDYARGVLYNLGIVPEIQYQNISPPQVTPGLVLNQSPASGQTISGEVVLTLSGAVSYNGISSTVFSHPATLTGNDDNP